MDDHRLTNFVAFLQDVNIHYDDKRIHFFKSKLQGYGVVACADIAVGDVVANIPKTAILSVETAALWSEINKQTENYEEKSETLPRDEWCPPLFQLPAAVLFETLLGKKSRWFHYLNVLPTSLADIGVPLGEKEETLNDVFQGTGIDILTSNMRAKLKQVFDPTVRKAFYHRARELNIDRELVEKLSWCQFALAFSWVTSRAFEVDEFHGNSLVPVADMFNHSTDEEHVHIEGATVKKSDSDSDSDDDDDDDDDYAIDEEGLDDDEHGAVIANGHTKSNADHQQDTRQDTRPDSASPTLNGLDMLRDGSVDEDEAESDLKIVCVRRVKRGEEVFNTFGQKCNTVLYLNYGFTEVHNMYDTAFVYRKDVEEVLSELRTTEEGTGPKQQREREACIDTAGVLIYDDVVDDFFQINTDGTFCHGLLLLAYLHMVPWMTIQPLCNDELELLDHLMQLSLRDVMEVRDQQMTGVVRRIARRVEDRYPEGSSLGGDRDLLTGGRAGSRIMRHALRIRIGQRKAMKVACEKIYNIEHEQSEDFGSDDEGEKCIVERVRKKAKAD